MAAQQQKTFVLAKKAPLYVDGAFKATRNYNRGSIIHLDAMVAARREFANNECYDVELANGDELRLTQIDSRRLAEALAVNEVLAQVPEEE